MQPHDSNNEFGPPLCEQIAQGDAMAFNRVHALYKTPLTYYAQRFVGDLREVEDIISESFLALWRSRTSIRSDIHLRNFLYQVVKHRSINYLDAKKREDDFLNMVKDGPQEVDQIHTDDVQAELLNILHQAVKSIPAEYARVFELSYFKQLSPTEIARALNINPSTVRTQKQRAVAMVKEWIRRMLPVIIGFLMIWNVEEKYFDNFFHFLRRCAMLVCNYYL